MRLVWMPVVVVPCLAAVDYQRDIRPILERQCYACHGPKLSQHGLRLDAKSAALKGGSSGAPAIVPGQSSASLLYRYVAGLDKDIVMPPAGPRLSAVQIDLLKRWIDEGAPWPEEPAVSSAQAARRGENHWAFRPRTRPETPQVRNRAWVRNPIDAFILARLEAKGWTPNPPAAREQLLRRLYLDLTGLPPVLSEQQDPRDLDAVAADLLARPAYAERWARHWLDLVRYAESNGYERDGAKPNAWKYRDYVIRSLHQDKPFDRFLIEQVAGDQLDNFSAESLIATGYYRLGPWDDEPADPKEDRFDQLDDILSTSSQVFLGLTLGCARCHNHKFEPLTAQDYYSMVAIFDGLERPRKARTELDLPVGTRAELDREAARDKKIEPIEKQITELREPFRDKITKKLPTDEQLAKETQLQIANLTGRIAEIRRLEPDLPRGYFLHEPHPAPPTRLLIRGKATAPGPEVPPAVPAVLVKTQPEFPNERRRLAFARWLAHPDNPLTARVIVNRIWRHHFGEGLVRTPSDFGVMGEKPAHPELLDWLADWFIENGWSFKKLHTLILSSNAWRMSKQQNPAYTAEDPENRLWWRVPYTRLEVEAIRDSMLVASGRLNPKRYGPSMFPAIQPQALEGSSDPDKIWKASDPDEQSRRTIYIFLKRSMIVPMLEVLDLCDTTRTSARRLTTSVAPQALTLLNGDFVNRQARYLAWRLLNEVGPDRDRQIERAWRLALARPPKPPEFASMRAFLERESVRNGELKALEEMCRVVFNLNEFVYTD